MADPRFYESARPLSLTKIETLSGASFEGLAPDGVFVDDVAPITATKTGSLSYAERRPTDVKAGAVILAKPEFAAALRAAGCHVGVTEHPRVAFAHAAAHVFTERPLEAGAADIDPTATIHDGAFIAKGARIGSGAIIEPNVVIGPGVEIGAGALIRANAVISFATIGADTEIGSCTVIGKTGFAIALGTEERVKVPHFGRSIIGSGVLIGASCSIDRGLFGDTEIGDNCQIDNFCQIAHNVRIGSGTVMAAFAGISGSTTIGRDCLFAGRCATTDNIKIGNNVTLLADSAAMYDIPDGEKWAGSPAMPARNFLRQISQLRRLSGIKGAQGKKTRRD